MPLGQIFLTQECVGIPDAALVVPKADLPAAQTGLDAVTGGMNNSDLVILAARPGMGKTSFALNLATNVARRTGREVAIYSLEMGMEQLASRMISTEALVNAHKLRTGRMEPAEWNRIASSADVLSRLNLRISEATGITVPQMKAQLL